MKHIVYKITNTLNNFFYIGVHSTKNIHDSYLGSGLHLKRALEKYGKSNFHKSILVICQSREEACYIEEQLINLYITQSNCYNIKKQNQYTQYLGLNKKNFKGSNNPRYGIPHSAQTKEKISKSKTGIKLGTQSQEHKRKKREARLLSFKVTDPLGTEYIVNDLPSFCSLYKLNYKRMSKLSRRTNSVCRDGICKGWSCIKIS